jgi:hypothetical protein
MEGKEVAEWEEWKPVGQLRIVARKSERGW